MRKPWRVQLLLVFVAILASASAVLPGSDGDRDAPRDVRAMEREVREAINAIRRKEGLRALAAAPELDRIARAHSEFQARVKLSGHLDADGRGPADRARKNGIRYRALAENVAMNHGYDEPVHVAVDGWMESPGHRRNILDPRFAQTGVGVAVADDGSIYFTQPFLDPR